MISLMGNLKESYKRYKEKRTSWFYNHFWVKRTLDEFVALIICTTSAFLFAFGFNCFMDLANVASLPKFDPSQNSVSFQKIVSGGASGFSQVIVLIIELIYEAFNGVGSSNGVIPESLLNSILYFVINVPLLFLAWFGIGRRFAIFTLINVIETSLFINLMNVGESALMQEIAYFVGHNGGLLSRCLIGGVCTGLSTALCFKIDASTGGVDVLMYYIGLKKKTLVGKYGLIMNAITLVSFTLLITTKDGWSNIENVAKHLAGAFFSTLYLIVTKLVIDSINVRNKKMKVEIITNREDLGEFLIESLPHAATMVIGKGVYTGSERYIFSMVVSSYELSSIINLIKKEDPSSFVQVVPLMSVTGRFYTKPVR